MIPQEKIEQAANNHFYDKCGKIPDNSYLFGFESGVRFAEAEMKKIPSKSATEYLESKGRRIEGINCFTGEYVVTPEQMDEYASQKAQKFAEWISHNGYKIVNETWDTPFEVTDLTTAELYDKFEAEGRGNE